MSHISMFEIMGPIMVGPSSSHTAGALRLGRAARIICGSELKSALFLLHGSFAKTYRGHGTDRALVAGILGMTTEDEQIKDSLRIAEEAGIPVRFEEADLGDVHPNTLKIALEKMEGGTVTVTGSSLGGGKIRITAIDLDEVSFDGNYPVIVLKHQDRPGMISRITGAIAACGVNIATLKVGRLIRGETATTVVETDHPIPDEAVETIQAIDGVISVRVVNLQ